MTDSTDSIENNEVVKDEGNAKLRQIPGATTAEVLNAIGSESEQIKFSNSKASNQYPIGLLSSKHSKHDDDEDVLNESNENKLPETLASNLSCPKPKESKSYELSEIPDPVVISKSNNEVPKVEDSQPANEVPQVDMVPESMYSALQQRAQNVLKMISEKRCSDASPPSEQVCAISRTPSSQNQSQQSILKKSSESADENISKSSDTSNTLTEEKNSQLNNHSSHKTVNLSVPKCDISGNLSYNVLQQKEDTAELVDKASSKAKKPESKTQCFPASESQQSSRSTEQCTTDYSVKSWGAEATCPADYNKCETKTNANDMSTSKTILGCLQQQCTLNKNASESVTPPAGNEFKVENEDSSDQIPQPNSTSGVIKELSQIIDANDLPINLTKRGEHICQMFKQKLLMKLESNGNLDETSAEIANVTAAKFAKWMEDILNKIDSRTKAVKESQKIATNDLSGIREEGERDNISATSKDSIGNEKIETPSKDEDSEVIKIQEITDSELIEKYGSYLLRESYDLFEFVGPDSVPVEVRHITALVSKKVMIVKKKTADLQWSNWVIEVGPEVSLESVSGSISQTIQNEEGELLEKDAGQWSLKNTEWDLWKPKMFDRNVGFCRIPKLKKQCMMKDEDFGIEYPTYPIIYTQTIGNEVFDDNITIPPSADKQFGSDQDLL